MIDQRLITVLAVLALVPYPSSGQVNLRFSGLGDVLAGVTTGDYADALQRSLIETFGSDPDPVNTTRGFGLTGFDFVVISDLSADLTFLGEVNLQSARGRSGDIETDVERAFMDFRVHPKFNVQAGLFFTPIGFNNRFLYARAWLMNSTQVPDFYEEELNLVPTHTTGVAVYGEFFLGDSHRLNYIVSAGNGRATTPDAAVYARDPSPNKEFTALIELLLPGYKTSRIGLSGWTGTIETVKLDAMGDVSLAALAEPMEMRETGLDAFIVWNTRLFSLNGEIVYSRRKDLLGNLFRETYTMTGGMVEAAVHLMDGKIHPYLRYDQTSLPGGGGPYLSLRGDGDEFRRVFVPEFQAMIGGVAYDLDLHVRLKIEYARHLDGPRRRSALTAQAAFGF